MLKVILLLTILAPPPATANGEAMPRVEDQARQTLHMAQYKPRKRRGAPATRVGGATRGAGDDAPIVQVLSPPHTGYTGRERPVLHWYLSKPIRDQRVEVTFVDEDKLATVLEYVADEAIAAGVHAVDLAAHGVRLAPGVEYRWTVALVMDAAERSRDIISSGTILRVEDPVAPGPGTDAVAQATRLAEDGLWYDAVDTLSQALAADPGNAAARTARARLLDEGELGDVVRHDRAR